ncbi:DNA polymerase phi-domain-containing protein [Hyaloraphidium curvatum]|nr:DNA polymerase phi-domain-containing protein [Hyaloraphidium curvatum]
MTTGEEGERPATILELFWDLASLDAADFEPAEPSDDESEEESGADAVAKAKKAERTLDALCAPDVSYSVKRLIRGLPSSREGARQGFAVALTELLAKLPYLSLGTVLDLLAKYTATTGAMKGQEEKEMLLGRLFCAMAIVEARVPGRRDTSEADIVRLVELLLACASAKSYLIEPAYAVLVMLLDQMKARGDSSTELADKVVRTVLKDGLPTFEDVWFAVEAQRTFPDLDWPGIIPTLKKGRPLHPASLSQVIDIFMESSHVHPRLHRGWETILDLVLAAGSVAGEDSSPRKEKKSKGKVIGLDEFWNQLVEERLFNSSHERKFLALRLFEKLLPRLTPEQIPRVFTPNFLRTLANNMGDASNYLHKAAHHAVRAVLEATKERRHLAVPFATRLLSANPSFDRKSRSKTAEALVAAMDPEGSAEFAGYLRRDFLRPPEGGLGTDAHRRWCADQMAALVRARRAALPREAAAATLRFLFACGLVETDDLPAETAEELLGDAEGPEPALSADSRAASRDRFLAALSELCTPQHTGGKGPAADPAEDAGPAEERPAAYWAREMCAFAADIEAREGVELLRPLSEAAAEARKRGTKLVKRIRERLAAGPGKAEASQLAALEMLVLHMVLQLYFEPKEAQDLLGELEECFQKGLSDKAVPRKRKSAEMEDGADGASPQSVEVIVDIVLSLLSRPSALLRNVAEQAFRAFSAGLTPAAVDLVLAVLEAKDGAADGVVELTDDEDEEDGGEEDDMEVDEEDGASESGSSSGGSEVDSNDEEEGDGEENGVLDQELQQLRADLAKAMDAEDLIASGDEGSDAESEDMDDDQMAAFDEKLAEVFRNRKSAKGERQNAKKQLVHFKLRALDLLDIHFRRTPDSPLALRCAVSLLESLRRTPTDAASAPLRDKLSSLLRNRVLKAKPARDPTLASDAESALSRALELASRAPDAPFASLCSSACLLALRQCDPAAGARAYAGALAAFVSGKGGYRAALFLNLAERNPPAAWAVLREAAGGLGRGKGYPLAQAYGFAAAAFQRLPKEASEEEKEAAIGVLRELAGAAAEAFSGGQKGKEAAGKKDKKDKKAKKAADAESPAVPALPAERRKEILKHLLAMARRARNLLGDGWEAAKGSLGLDKAAAAAGSEDKVRGLAGQLAGL